MKRDEKLTTLEWCIIAVVLMAVFIILVCIIIPPPGVVDESVKDCLWILAVLDGILAVVFCVHKGIDAKLEKGDMSLTITNPDPEQEKEVNDGN